MLCYCVVCSVYVEILDRQQRRLELVLIPIECFSVCTSSDGMEDIEMTSLDSSLSSSVQVITEDSSDVWINVRY